MLSLADMDLGELERLVAGHGQPAYRAAQLFGWVGRGAPDVEAMSDVPKAYRARLAQEACTGVPEVAGVSESERDGTRKYVLLTRGGEAVESVLMRYRHGLTACVSSQAGCRMGCAFCASKPDGFLGGLTAGEMFGQVAAIARHGGEPIGNVVVMGVGEPFDNFENTMKFARLLHEHPETGIGYRRVTVSTCGLVPGIAALAESGLPIGLSVSLHAPDDATRGRLMPVNAKYSIDKLLAGCKMYIDRSKRRVTFEYALIDGVNDSPAQAAALCRLLRGMLCHVNLIAANPVEGAGFAPSGAARARAFAGALERGGVNATVRRGLGQDIRAACGQLRNRLQAPGGGARREVGGQIEIRRED